jgi:PAS domain S-box-containing protein
MFISNGTAAAAARPCIPTPAPDPGKQDFLKLAEISPAMMWMADSEGLCTYVNASWLEFRGRTLTQELGAGWMEGLHPEDAGPCLGEFMAGMANRRSLLLSYRMQRRDGHHCRVDHALAPWSDPEGSGHGFVGTICLVDKQEEQLRNAMRQLSFLSVRERQMLELIARGYATKEAAGRLGISYKTADSHRSHLLKKLGIHETASLVRFAVRSGLVSA